MKSIQRRRRRAAWLAAVVLATSGVALGGQVIDTPPAQASPTQVDSAVIGWEGDWWASMAHRDGSFDIQADGKRGLKVGFGIYNNPAGMQWSNAEGYLPALVTQFERDNSTVTITNFGDKVTVGGNDYVAVYSRVSVRNHDSVARTLDPAPSPQFLPLNSAPNTVAPGQTVNHDYVIATDRFGNTYPWPADTSLIAAGGYDARYSHMKSYWNGRLAGIAQIDLPDTRLVNAFKAGFIYTNIVKDGPRLNVGENEYDRPFDHDLIGMVVSLIQQGELVNAKDYLQTLFHDQYPDAAYKYSWPWAVYLQKTGDTAYVSANFTKIRDFARSIVTSATGPGGTMKLSPAIDHDGYWTLDSQSALVGLLAYKYIAQRLGNTTEVNWATAQYNTLFTAVNNQLQKVISANNLSYIPCSVTEPNTRNACGQTNNANWGSMLMFGRWNWDGYLFGAAQSGPMASLLDSTYDYGFAHLSGLPAHTFGGYPGYSTSYNAAYGEAALAGTKYRSEGIYAYEFMINNTQSAPFSWWEGIPTVGTTNWSPGTHATSGSGSSPHMWGQTNASKVLLDSLIAEKSNGQALVGRGIPNEWLSSGRQVSITNYPIAGGRMGATVTSTGNTVTLNLSGSTPSGGVQFSLPAFIGNIASATTGTVDNAKGEVTLPSGTTNVTVTLSTAPTYKQLGGINLDSYCKSIGNAGGVITDGNTVNDWKCVTGSGDRIGLSVNEACAWQYPYNAAAFSKYTDVNDRFSWKCYSS
ncbi:hypothetical protein [Sphaerisporangium sp. NPDC051011]|uniref:hypothetical protein n=1 Tax=Sphaerisporangium sp. NPDC051011 TaxID=3155792 RepID=UPI0033D67F7C